MDRTAKPRGSGATDRKLGLAAADVRRARTLARQVGRPIVKLAQQHTTVSVERATLRLAGLAGADSEGTPWVNRLADVVRADVGLEHGLALPVWDALLRGEGEDLLALAQKAAAGSVQFRLPEGRDLARARAAARKQVAAGVRRIDARRRERDGGIGPRSLRDRVEALDGMFELDSPTGAGTRIRAELPLEVGA